MNNYFSGTTSREITASARAHEFVTSSRVWAPVDVDVDEDVNLDGDGDVNVDFLIAGLTPSS